MPPLQGQITFDAIAAKPEFQQAPSDVQRDVALRYFEDNYASKPEFKNAPVEVQNDAKQRFFKDYNISDVNFQAAPGRSTAPVQMETQTPSSPPRTLFGFKFNGPTMDDIAAEVRARESQQQQPIAGGLEGMAATMAQNNPSGFGQGVAQGLSKQIKGFTLGYTDPFSSGQHSPMDEANQFLGTIPLWELGAKGLDKALPMMGRAVLPYTTELAQAAGVGSRFVRPAMEALTHLQGPAMWARMIRSGLPFGAIAGLESQPGHQLDIGRRAQAAAGGFTAGAILPPLESAGGKVLQGVVKAGKNLFGQAETAPITLAGRKAPKFQDYQNKVIQTFNDVKNTIMDIYHGNIKHEHVSPQDAAKLARDLDVLGEGMKTGNLPKMEELTTIRNTVRRVRGKAMIKAKIEARKAGYEPQGQTEQPKGQQHAEVTPQGEQQAAPATQPVKEQKTLTGSVSEMVDQALKDAGLKSLDDVRGLQAEIKALGRAEDDPRILKLKEERQPFSRKKDDASIEARAKIDAKIQEVKQERNAKRETLQGKLNSVNDNLKELLNTTWDESAVLADQLPVDPAKQLTWEQVKSLIPENRMADAEKMNRAMEAGKSARVEHTAEITGSTDAAAKITAAGKVKVPISTYTPTHWTVTEKVLPSGQKKSFVAAMGYNEAGYQHKYYVQSPEGSNFKVTKLLDTEQHVGTVPNVYLGQRKFKVADVLGRAPKEEAVLTSDALAAAQSFKEIFKPDNLKQFSKATQSELKGFQKRGKFDQSSFERLHAQMMKNPEDLKTFCRLFGLV